jgi:hypothetical protein
MNRNKSKKAYGYIYSENYFKPIMYGIIEKNKKYWKHMFKVLQNLTKI